MNVSEQPVTESSTEKKHLKDRASFVIVTSIVVPILVSILGILGVILPILIDRSLPSNDNNTETQESSVTPTSFVQEQVTNSEVVVVKPQDINGYLSASKIVEYVKAKNYTFTPNTISQSGDFEVQRVSGEYYLIGFSSEILKIDDLFLISSTSKEFPKKIKINLKDIGEIKTEDRGDKKSKITGLKFDTKKIEAL